MAKLWWANQSPELQAYYDTEWGFEQHDDRALFELLALEIMQIGLNWQLVLKKRPALNRAFHGFDPKAVAGMAPAEIEAMMQDPQLIRNRRKLEAVVTNAKAVLRIQRTHGSFAAYLWTFVDGKPVVNAPVDGNDSQSDATVCGHRQGHEGAGADHGWAGDGLQLDARRRVGQRPPGGD